jgi:diguanylate cyclase (GGDEF)-like protein
VRRLIAKELRTWGYVVEEAADGKEALERLIQLAESVKRPNLILLDWNMPELDGISLCKWIKSCQAYKKGPHLYVLFLTINEGSESETMAYRAGADGYVVKGSWEELEAKLSAVRDRILEEVELRNKISSLQQDPTGVLVKKEIIDRLGRRAAQSDQSPLGVVLIDIDEFKAINDVHGHVVGDQILEAIGKRLQDSVRNGNVGRYGGDEFLIGLPGCDPETTEKRAQDIVARLTVDPVSTSSGDITISICYGTAVDTESVSLDNLIDRADKALYRQKRLRKATARVSTH